MTKARPDCFLRRAFYCKSIRADRTVRLFPVQKDIIDQGKVRFN